MHSMSILKYATSFVLSVSAPFVVPRPAQTTPRYALTILGLVQHNYINSDFTPLSINDNGVIAGAGSAGYQGKWVLGTSILEWRATPVCGLWSLP